MKKIGQLKCWNSVKCAVSGCSCNINRICDLSGNDKTFDNLLDCLSDFLVYFILIVDLSLLILLVLGNIYIIYSNLHININPYTLNVWNVV